LYVLLLNSILPPRYHFVIGQTSPVTIRAPITAVDTAATEAAKQQAMAKVSPQYALSRSVETDAIAQLDKLFATTASSIRNKALRPADKLSSVTAVAPKGVTTATLKRLILLNPPQLSMIQSVTERIVHDILSVPFYTEMQQQAGLLVDRQLISFDLDRTSRLMVQNLAVSVLRPNMVYQKAATEAARQAAAKMVPDVMIRQGDIIVVKNGIITAAVESRLKDVGLYRAQPNYAMASGFALTVLIAVAMLGAYIERRGARRRVDNLMLVVMSLIVLLMAVLIAVTKGIINAGGPASTAYLVPISLGSMLITVLMDSSLAVVVSFFVSLLFGAALGFDYWLVFMSVVSSLVGAYSLARVKHRGTFMRAGFLVAGMNVAAIVTMHLLQTDHNIDLHSFVLRVGLGALNGVISAILTMGILPFFESAFGILTAIHLLELSNPNNPLLRKLLLEAPGTYHHSLIVGNLAEAAAEMVGADPLICRVGAYYHDIGKTRRPMFFVENQLTKENPHDKISPSLSHLIITSHVTDGLEILENAGMPKPIRDICATHHGTSILWYFYNKAKEQDKNGTVHVDDFRYPGPKPKTRECAIVMICDAVEAAVRSMPKPTPNRVEGVIRKIIRDRLQDGQLDECDLTLQDLDAMVGAFMKTLSGIYHARIEYPDPDKIRKEMAK
jgi:putative nucleotidyltransferase with HDIG domain